MIARIMTQPLAPTTHYPYHYTSTLDALSTILRKEGWSALYKGLGPSVLGVSHVVVQFPLYEYLKSLGDGKLSLTQIPKGKLYYFPLLPQRRLLALLHTRMK